MTSATELLSKFNDTFVELLDDLIRVFPEDGDFKMYKLGLQTALMTDDALAMRIFAEEVGAKYATYITERNEAFFLEQDYSEYKDQYSDAAEIIHKLKKCWVSLGTEERDVIWRYLRVLTLLQRKYAAAA